MELSLTLYQRIQLCNQYKLLALLDKDEKEDAMVLVTILQNGFEGDYSALTAGFSEPLSEEECSFVVSVLYMYTDFEWAKNNGIKIAPEDDHLFEFTGFDGNEESPHFTYASFLIGRPRHWESLKLKETNSHRNMVPRYRRMVAAWKVSENTHELTSDDFARIAIAARAH